MVRLRKDVIRVKERGATYQRCMQSYFKEQIGRNLEVYVDDIVVKTRQSNSLILNLEETFTNLRCFNIRLNLENAPVGSPEANF
jgi:hypothetical protein